MRAAASGVDPPLSRRLPRTTAGYATLAGLAALLGWAFDVRRLTDWYASGTSMPPNAALAALLAGIALLAWRRADPRLLTALGLSVATIATATVLEHLTGVDLGIDDPLRFGRDWSGEPVEAPGRMGPPAA